MRIVILIIAALLLSISNVLSQGTTGNLEGWVTDENEKPLESVNIVISSQSLLGTRGATSNQDGYFIITSIPPGDYNVSISSLSYQKVLIKNLVIILDKTTSIGKIVLEPEAVGMDEVIISAEKSEIDVNSTSYGQNFASSELDLLPLQREYQQIAQLAPEAKESYLGDGISIGGASGKENKYFINGVGVTDPFANWFSTELPYNFIRGIEIKTGAYEAEYESSLGGLVNVITPSGSNEFYGVAFGFFNNDRISGNEISIGEPPKSSFIRTDAGLGIGGPIIQDRLWFYAAFDAQYNSVQVSLSNLGDQNFATVGNLFAGKLTWLVNNSNKIDLVVFGDPRYGDGYLNYPLNATFDENFNFRPYIYDANYHALAQGNHTLGKNSFLESYINFSRFLSKQNTENPNGMTEPLYYDLTTNTISGDVTWTDWRSDEIKLGLKGTHISGNHLIKAGIEYLNSTRFDKTDYNEIDKYGDSSFVQIIYTTDTKVSYRIPTLFLQDSWSISSYFRLNAGARWNYVFMVGSDGKVAQTIPDQIAPRLGIMFLPDGDNRQMISLSAGRFYHTFPAMLLTSYYSENSYSSAAFFTEDPRNEGAEGEVFYEPRAEIYPKIDNLKGPHYDEITIGYERELPLNLLGNIKLIYRTLVDGIEDGVDPETGELVLGNPGKGDMSAFPKMQRDYIAFEIVLSSNITTNYNFQVSYILSRLYGNYTGFYDTESGMCFMA